MRDIGKNIRSIRQEKNMTQEALADALFVTRQTVSNYENGRSRPDLDTLLNIAAVLETDIHTLIYGPPIPPSKKSAYKWAAISFGLAILVWALYIGLHIVFRSIYRKTYAFHIITATHLNKEILLPLAMFTLGWTLFHGLGLLGGLRQLQGKKAKAGRIILFTLGCMVVLLPLPLYIWQFIGLIRSATSTSVSMTFPHIPVYTEILFGMTWLVHKAPFIYCLLGSLYWLFGIPCPQVKGKA